MGEILEWKEIIQQQCKVFNKKIPNDVYVKTIKCIPFANIEFFDYKYEVIVTSRNAPNYKYRICFIKYIDFNTEPIVIDIDEDIADELNLFNTVILIHDKTKLIDFLEKSFNSNKVLKVISTLSLEE